MFHKYFKLILSLGMVVLSTLQFIEGNLGNGFFLSLLSLFFLFFYFKNEFLLLAFFQIRKQNFEKTEKWLNKIKNPTSVLITSQQAYFYYLQGLLFSQKNLNESERLLKKALSIGLKMKHDIAMAKLNLAAILINKRRKREAISLLNEAKKLDKYNILTSQIKTMKEQLKKI